MEYCSFPQIHGYVQHSCCHICNQVVQISKRNCWSESLTNYLNSKTVTTNNWHKKAKHSNHIIFDSLSPFTSFCSIFKERNEFCTYPRQLFKLSGCKLKSIIILFILYNKCKLLYYVMNWLNSTIFSSIAQQFTIRIHVLTNHILDNETLTFFIIPKGRIDFRM